MTIAFSRKLEPTPSRLPLLVSQSREMSQAAPVMREFLGPQWPESGDLVPKRSRKEGALLDGMPTASGPVSPGAERGSRLGRPGRMRGMVRRLCKLAYVVVRPLIRPAAFRVRTFLLRDVSPLLMDIHAAQGALSRDIQALAKRGLGASEPADAQRGGGGQAAPARIRHKVHQFHAGSATGDAITNAMLLIQRQLRQMGFESEIYVEHLGAGLEGRLRGLDALPVHDDHVLIVHHSMGHPGFARVMASPAPKVLIYHNITPPEFLDNNPHMQRAAELGREQLAQWRDNVVAALADSRFNAMELRRLGFAYVREATLLFDTDTLLEQARGQRPPRSAAAFTVLFVGRVVPSKGHADLVAAFALFARSWSAESDRAVRLVLAGAEQDCSRGYPAELEAQVRRLGLQGQVLLTGKLSDASLHDWYGRADLYVSMSRHEGFGVPLVEAMAHGVPVIARAVGAVPATLGPGALLLEDGDPVVAAAAMLRVARDPHFAGEITGRQARHLQNWALVRHLPILRQALSLAGAAAAAEPPDAALALAEELHFDVVGHMNGSYSLASVNRSMALALEDMGPGRVRVHGFEVGVPASVTDLPAPIRERIETLVARKVWGGPVVAISQHYPVLVPPAGADAALAMVFWEESALPREMVCRLNESFQGVLAPATSVARALVESGVRVPVRVTGFAPALDAFAALRAERAGRLLRQEAPRTFLHVSSCFPRKGVDLLLTAWAQAFRASDPVRLVIKSFPNPHNTVRADLATLRAEHADLAEIVLYDADFEEAVMLQLYREADVMVLPTRGEGFNLPAAEAMAAGLHLIVTGHGGHMDFCADPQADVRLLAYRLQPAASHVTRDHALWAEPELDDLVQALREAAARPLEVPQAALPPGIAVMNPVAWARRIATEAAAIMLRPMAEAPRITWISPWQVRCGVAEYSRHMLGAFRPDGLAGGRLPTVLSDQRAAIGEAGSYPAVRIQPVFRLGDATSLPRLMNAIAAEDADVVIIQHQPGILSWPDLAELLESWALAGRCTVVTLHNTLDLLRASPLVRARVGVALAGVSRVLVHAVADIARLRSLGVHNTVWLPHGTTAGPAPRRPVAIRRHTAPVIGTTGFILPHKGLQRLLAAAALLRRHWPDLRLRLVTARYPDEVSDRELAVCEELIDTLGLRENVEWYTGFEPHERMLELLGGCDLLVMPYAATLESSSGAVRQALASGVPTLVSDISLFDDLDDAVERVVDVSAEGIALRVATLLRRPELRAQIQDRAQAWLAAHDWSLIAGRLQDMLVGLLNEHRDRLRG